LYGKVEELSKTERRIETAKAQAVRQRNYRRARDRALARLSNDYPNVYRTYLEEEMEADDQMGKKWLEDYASAGWDWRGREWECLLSLWTSESRFDNYAKNQRGSSAYGIAQLLRETDSRPEYQILRGLKYISKRYETPCKAYKFFLKHNYY